MFGENYHPSVRPTAQGVRTQGRAVVDNGTPRRFSSEASLGF